MTDKRPMTAEQAATLKQLAKAAYELDAFKPNLTRSEADIRIATQSEASQPTPPSWRRYGLSYA
jgi:hypothetical protein